MGWKTQLKHKTTVRDSLSIWRNDEIQQGDLVMGITALYSIYKHTELGLPGKTKL